MRGKWPIAIIGALLVAISLYQLSFTLVTKQIENEAAVEAAYQAEEFLASNPGEDLDVITDEYRKNYLDSIWEKEVYLGLPYKKVKRYALNLGLDLQGGTHATVVVSPVEIIKGMAFNNPDEAFNTALSQARKDMRTQSGKYTDLFYTRWKENAAGRKLNEIFLSPDNPDISLSTPDEEILESINTALDEALDMSVVVLRSRIDKFGASNPIINPIKSTGRIEVELPGFDNDERVRTQLEKMARLEFVKPYDAQKSQAALQSIISALRDAEIAEKRKAGVADSLLADSVYIAEIQKLIVGPGPEYVPSFLIEKRNREKFLALLETPTAKAATASDLTFMFDKGTIDDSENGNAYKIVYLVEKGATSPALLDGERIERAYASSDQLGRPAVSITFDAQGTVLWSDITASNVGKIVMITLDNEVYSYPTINEVMNTGNCQISGSFTNSEVIELSNILNAGRLPAPTEIESMVKVGPSMGATAIQQGLLSLLAGLALVIGFMIFYYKKGGLVANIALLFNIFFILGILATPSFGVTLTLPGIAGIVLTIGMSIDANVLIFERIREELALGKNKANAIAGGYSKAFWTIFDANITTFLSGLVLYNFGTGLVKGFAVTLMVGVVSSFFAAVFITRLIVEFMGEKNNYEKLSFASGLADKLFKGQVIDFIGKRKMGYIFSGIVLATGIGIMATQGLNLGVAFKGGYSFVYSFDGDVDPVAVRSSVKDIIKDADVQVKSFDSPNQVQITTSYLIDSDAENAAEQVQSAIETGLASYANPSLQRLVQVGATIAEDIKTTSRNSVIIALLVIVAYIIVRFRKWQFGIGSLVALFHDVLFVLSVFAIAGAIGISFEIDEVFIASVLTLVGYSINDTVVVFDRVREYIGDGSGVLKNTLNRSLSHTLSRTVITSVTTLIVVLVLLIFGGENLRGFSFALFIGILVGTYSSIFIATPVVYDLSKKEEGKE